MQPKENQSSFIRRPVHRIFAEVSACRAGIKRLRLVEEVIDSFYTYSPKINDYYCQYYRAVPSTKYGTRSSIFAGVERNRAIQELKMSTGG